MVNELQRMENIFNNMKDKEVNVWQCGGEITTPVLVFENFDWGYCNGDFESYIVLYNGEFPMKINCDLIHSLQCDEDLNEIVFFMESGNMVQVWIDME